MCLIVIKCLGVAYVILHALTSKLNRLFMLVRTVYVNIEWNETYTFNKSCALWMNSNISRNQNATKLQTTFYKCTVSFNRYYISEWKTYLELCIAASCHFPFVFCHRAGRCWVHWFWGNVEERTCDLQFNVAQHTISGLHIRLAKEEVPGSRVQGMVVGQRLLTGVRFYQPINGVSCQQWWLASG